VFVDLISGDEGLLQLELRRMERVQSIFANCFAVILLRPDDMPTWNRVQLSLEYGELRLFHATSRKDVPDTIYNYFCVMKDSCKLEQQSHYFEEVKNSRPDLVLSH
jgi:hypothetical protein